MQFIDFFYPHIALIALGSGMFTLVLHRVWRPDATLIAFSIFSFAISASFALMTWVLWQGGNVPIVVYAVQHILFAIGFVTFYEANRLQLDGVRGRAEVFCLYLVSAFLIVLLVVSIIAPERIVVTIVHDSLGQYIALMWPRTAEKFGIPGPAVIVGALFPIWILWTWRHLEFLWNGRRRFETKLMVPLVFFSIVSPIYDIGVIGGFWGGILSSFFTFGIAAVTAGFWLVYQLWGHSRELLELNLHLEERVDARTRELKSANVQLEEVSALKNDFLAICSHDLKNLLVAIQGYAELLEMGLRGSQERGELLAYSEEVQHSTRRMLDLIKDLLDSARLESGRTVLQVRRIWLPEVVGEAFSQYKRDAVKQQVTYNLELSEGLPELDLDASKMQQAIANLLHNALKFTPEGGTVTCAARASGTGVEIHIADSGPGIAEEDQGIIFDKFAIARKRRQERNTKLGTGLGLSITKRFVELHGGSVRVESALGKGTRFIIYLPGPASVATFAT